MATLAITGKSAPLAMERTVGLHATEWTLVTFDSWVIGVNNQGVGSVWVARGLSGTRNATDDQVEVKPGTTVDFRFGAGRQDDAISLSLFGADGATHPVGLVLERRE